MPDWSLCLCPHSDQMGNKASYIHLQGSDLRPQFHQFTAVVSQPRGPLLSPLLGLGRLGLGGPVGGQTAWGGGAGVGLVEFCTWYWETSPEAALLMSPLSCVSGSPASP